MELEGVSADAPNQLLPSHSWEALPVTCDLQPKIEPYNTPPLHPQRICSGISRIGCRADATGVSHFGIPARPRGRFFKNLSAIRTSLAVTA